ncbi:MAG: hypothetical protein Q4A54_05555 [Parabacteroides sp.]|nr:hypothetical protein [Parabacteroides sp.]
MFKNKNMIILSIIMIISVICISGCNGENDIEKSEDIVNNDLVERNIFETGTEEEIENYINSFAGEKISDLLPELSEAMYPIVYVFDGKEISNIDPNLFYLYFGAVFGDEEIRLVLLDEDDMTKYGGYEEILEHFLPKYKARPFAEKFIKEKYPEARVSFAGYYPFDRFEDRETWCFYGGCKIDGEEYDYKVYVTGTGDKPEIKDYFLQEKEQTE